MSAGARKETLDDRGFLFRFRTARALLDDDPKNGGFHELEKQAIYFAQPEALNDPMEGINDAFWDGDQVLWENLFRHYSLSLFQYASEWLLHKPEEIAQARVGAWLTEMDLPSDTMRDIYREFRQAFCAAIESFELASALGRRTAALRRERLTTLLFLVHRTALHHLFRVFRRHRLSNLELPTRDATENPARTVIDSWESIVANPNELQISVEDRLELMASISNRANHQLELGMLSRVSDTARAKKIIALFARFPETYVDAFLRDLHFTPWRVACFSGRCVNASMWGTYAAGHSGAALVFRTQQRGSKRFFTIHGMLGTGAKGHQLEVRSVSYRNRPPPLDSFVEIARLPMATLECTWMRSESGAPSVRLQELTNDIESWQRAHWDKAFERATWKHPDWAHEDEQRLIASTPFTDDPAPKPLTYDFSQLEGIVFGMRMSAENKLRIARVVEQKCRAEGRADFRFFQAFYSSAKGEMDLAELGLLKFQ